MNVESLPALPCPATPADFIRRGGEVEECDLWEMSPSRIWWGDEWWRDAVALLHALFLPGEWVNCGKAWETHAVRRREDWVASWKRGEEIPPFVCVNPLRGEGRRGDENLAAFRHAVAKLPALPIDLQARFWAGWGLDSVAAVVHSGGQSLHVVLRVDAAGAREWERDVRDGLFGKRLVPLGVPVSCASPSCLVRLAGAARQDRSGTPGTRQRLVFVRGELGAWGGMGK